MSAKRDEISTPPPVVEEPYSIFTAREKWFIVSLVAFGGLFSPLSANIYFPAIPTLAVAFHKSIELINLTVTLNMVFQGLSPMVWGTISDTYGRRHSFILCLLLLSVSCVGLALTPTSDYWLLLFLRCFQAAGSASTVAILMGVIGDISTRADRGSYLGLATVGPMASNTFQDICIGPAIGPVLGGLLADKLGWRWIFWFLCIASAACMVVLILFLPETLRAIVGNGSIPLPPIYHPVIPIIGRHAKRSLPTTTTPPPKRKFQNPLLLLLHVDIALLLLINGIVYSVFYGVTASISTVFHDAYPQLNETELGLCFLTVGSGMSIGSLFCGRLLDWDYRKLRRTLRAQDPTAEQVNETSGKADEAFPIERARLRLLPAFLALFVVSCIGYGWCIDKRTNIAGPLILLIGVGLVVITLMNSIQTLMLDLIPTQGSAITACVRASIPSFSFFIYANHGPPPHRTISCDVASGRGLVSGIQPLLDALGAGYAYLLLGGLSALMGPLLYLVMYIGPRCRARRVRIAEVEREKEAEDDSEVASRTRTTEGS
ncbi:MFS general substrate transporter [Mycena venus]|uniref:MFS general substrate transporter n=1 Tax=Mycena venus TaxID=2733690 RepID=A0A8H6YDV3_9AGAR|nr:MFS general substrate transporter [Mycena venus]